ncbi:Uncharacterized protein Adt_11569 [Abeliophyllum distichum]|uniref:Retrotransposon gag domain-containing protein n=1 Tax=Abeliophyllum distichum TaxID=126358 RepID=A0ABD1UN78_9LAMI
MARRMRRRPGRDHQDEPVVEAREEQNTSLPFATIQQFTTLQEQMATIMNTLQRVTTPSTTPKIPQQAKAEISPVVKNLPAMEVSSSETMQMQKMTSTSRNSIPANWENILNKKVDEAITQRKNRGWPSSIKEDSFTEEVMNVALPPKFKEPTGDFDSTIDLIDHLRLFQDRVRLYSWPDAIAYRAFPMTMRKDAREWFNILPSRSISSFSDFANKFALCFSSSAQKKKTTMGLMQISQEKGESLREYLSRFNRATLNITNLHISSVVTALLSGLRNHTFRASLSKRPPESMTELLRREEEYIDQEEVMKATKTDRDIYDGGIRKRRLEEVPGDIADFGVKKYYGYRKRYQCVKLGGL